jgi:thiol:disulfide interchange protein DsbC
MGSDMKILSSVVKNFCGLYICLFMVCGCATQSTPIAINPEASLRKAFPNLPFESIQQTEVQGLYEVTSGLNLFYYYPEKEYLFVGDIYTLAGKNITAEKKEGITANLAKNLPLDKAVVSGSGKTTIIEFTDPDCPFCKKAYDLLKTRQDVKIYTFFSPLAHPAAISKVHYILNAQDRSKAYHDVFDGKSVTPPAEGYSDAIKKLAQEHLDLARSVGVSGTPTFFINGKQVVGADIKKIEKLINESNNETKKPDK